MLPTHWLCKCLVSKCLLQVSLLCLFSLYLIGSLDQLVMPFSAVGAFNGQPHQHPPGLLMGPDGHGANGVLLPPHLSQLPLMNHWNNASMINNNDINNGNGDSIDSFEAAKAMNSPTPGAQFMSSLLPTPAGQLASSKPTLSVIPPNQSQQAFFRNDQQPLLLNGMCDSLSLSSFVCVYMCAICLL